MILLVHYDSSFDIGKKLNEINKIQDENSNYGKKLFECHMKFLI